MDNEMIERVAKTICEALFGPYDNFEANEAFHSPSGQAREAAKEAIKAMREPTERMKTLVTDDIVITDKCYYCGGHIQGWKAMIDAVIND